MPQPTPPQRRRLLAFAAFCLALGVALNIAVATICAIALPTDASESFFLNGAGVNNPTTSWLSHRRAFGYERVLLVNVSSINATIIGDYIDASRVPDLVLRNRSKSSSPSDIECHTAGWPFQSLSGWTERAGLLLTNNVPAIGVGRTLRSEGLLKLKFLNTHRWALRPQALTIPVWPGFIANTIFYALLPFSLLASIRVLRPTLRHRRGHCPRCAYDLRNLPANAPCPECGRNRNVAR